MQYIIMSRADLQSVRLVCGLLYLIEGLIEGLSKALPRVLLAGLGDVKKKRRNPFPGSD